MVNLTHNLQDNEFNSLDRFSCWKEIEGSPGTEWKLWGKCLNCNNLSISGSTYEIYVDHLTYGKSNDISFSL